MSSGGRRMLIGLLAIERDLLLEDLAAFESGEKPVSSARHERMLARLEELNREIAKLSEARA